MNEYQIVQWAMLFYISIAIVAAMAITAVAISIGATIFAGALWVFAVICYANIIFGIHQWVRLRRWKRVS